MGCDNMRQHLTPLALAVAIGLAQTAGAQERPAPQIEDARRSFGAFAAPAFLPPGANAVYGFAGVPEVGAGYRQGLDGLEIDARFKFDWVAVAFSLEALGKFPAWTSGNLQLAPVIGVGGVFDTGADYIDRDNFSYLGLRLTPGANLSYRVAETASLVGELAVPIDITLSPRNGSRVRPLIGGGAEFYIGEDLTAGAVAQVGVDVLKQPLGIARTRVGYAFRVGVGYRFF